MAAVQRLPEEQHHDGEPVVQRREAREAEPQRLVGAGEARGGRRADGEDAGHGAVAERDAPRCVKGAG